MDKNTKQVRLLGAFFLLVSCALAFVWFYWLAPVKRINSQAWWEQHSKQAYWKEEQKSIFRIGVTHDVGVALGLYGDKKWAAWIINHIKPGQPIFGCANNHLAEALADITNHQLEPEAETWLAWWKTNQNKTQVEWIREGFAIKGIVLQEPLTTNNLIDLLKLSHVSTNSPIYSNSPSYFLPCLRKNAFRWLRDSGFSPWQLFNIWDCDANNMPEADRKQITRALMDYAYWYGEHWNDPSKLVFPQRENKLKSVLDPHEPDFLTPKFRWTICFLIMAFGLAGIGMMRRQPRRK